MRLMKALATEGAYLILAMAEALDRSTYVYIQDIYESKSDTGPSSCLGLHSKLSMPAGSQECVPYNFWPFLDTLKVSSLTVKYENSVYFVWYYGFYLYMREV